jgi:preprotein translocase subunit SecE
MPLMNQQTIPMGGAMNTLKWAVVIALVSLGLIGNYQFSEQPLLLRISILAVLAVIAFVVALQTEKGKAFWQFATESRTELRKVVWPSRQETIQTTVMVLAIVAIVGLILWGVDIVLLKVIAKLTGYGAR